MSRFPNPISHQGSKQTGKNGSLFVMLCLVSVLLLGSRGYSQSPCINQSPRDLKLEKPLLDAKPPVAGLDYNYTSATPVMNPVDAKTVQYQGQTLHICDQHYHVPVENIQGCTDEKKGTPPDHGPPPVDQWIEFHSVYAMAVDSAPGCAEGPDRNLACCKTPPFVVRAFSAKVTGPVPTPPPIIQPNSGILAEWIGSNTSPDNPPGSCKPLPAQWSFRFGCEFTVSQSQLERDFHAHGAREVQPPKRLSADLTVVGTQQEQALTCREVETQLIQANEANTVCQAACKSPLNLFSGKWRNASTPTPPHGLCTCCPLPRPQ